ncbi:MAG: four-helix bundle copper-binding protein [Gemmatimonadales bacterium]
MTSSTQQSTQAGHDLEECIENCTNCHRICLETAAVHFRGEAPRDIPEALVRLLIDCAEICRTSADFMIRGSELHPHTCRACSAICERCADECDRMGDDPRMAACVEICRRCAQTCGQMAASLN